MILAIESTTSENTSAWDKEFAKLRARFPSSQDNVLFCIHALQQDPQLTLEDLTAQAALHGRKVGWRSLDSAKRLLGLRPPRKPRKRGVPQPRIHDLPSQTDQAERSTAMTKWNDNSYAAIVKQYPVLESKSEATAFCVLTYDKHPDLPTVDLKAMAAETGLTIAGRAMGSARQILGLAPMTSRAAAMPGRKRKTPKRSKAARKPQPSSVPDLGGLADALRDLERDRERLRSTLEKIRDLVDSAL